jgi:class 3 adenylate cyclase
MTLRSSHEQPHKTPNTTTDTMGASVVSDDENELSSVEDTSSDASTGHANGMDTTQKQQVKEVEEMAKKETKNMRTWKCVVNLTVMVTALVVSGGTYVFLAIIEKDGFEESYYSYANTIGDAAEVHAHNLFSTMRSCSNSISFAAATGNSEFPFVTVPGFEVLGESARQQSGAELLIFTPKVGVDEVTRWEEYATANDGWYEESKQLEVSSSKGSVVQSDFAPGSPLPFIYNTVVDEDGNSSPGPPRNPPFYPIWQVSPPPFSPYLLKANAGGVPEFLSTLEAADIAKEGVVGSTFFSDLYRLEGLASKAEDHEVFHAQFLVSSDTESAYDRPHGFFSQPIFREIYNDTSEVVGYINALVSWDSYFANLLPEGVKGIACVATNTCGQNFTYYLDGNKVSCSKLENDVQRPGCGNKSNLLSSLSFLQAIYAGQGDIHASRYNHMRVEIPFSDYLRNSTEDVPGHCVYAFILYPTQEYEENYTSDLPLQMFSVVGAAFCVMIFTFLAYDWFVQRHNQMVVSAAARANAILSTLFPKNVRDRLFEERELEERELEEKNKIDGQKKPLLGLPGNKTRLTTFLTESRNFVAKDQDDDDFMYKSKPIADLFPETTIMFGDISGFTAWSSTREPSQVFVLLETVYKAFDEIARRRRVFKVETIGDCYVAVAGLPNPRKDHAVVMARFSRDCMHRMNQLTRKLEVILGPDTTDLAMRFGLHSGPVTAGVLRGERSRFQLFGDTMNTACRMESNGLRDRIHVSQDTADLLLAAGKSKWLTRRGEKVVAKGKGEMQTYWVAVGSSNTSNSEGGTISGSDDCIDPNADQQGSEKLDPLASNKTTRLVKWSVEVLAKILKQVHARRDETNIAPLEAESNVTRLDHQTVLEEVQEIIHLPAFNGEIAKDQDDVELDPVVHDQLENYVSIVASMYRDNPFHNFEHASHVVMSVVKLLSRIVAPDIGEETGKDMASTLHDHTYGITSDPLTQFACVFSALIHDADHTGVPNTQLIKENSSLAEIYKDKSVAEQNSVDLCWDLLMVSDFDELRAAIYSTVDERKRFRQLVVNSVMATDIMDKELKILRNNRWAKAFSDDARGHKESKECVVDRKATIVIEHLIQASDVSHTMQHWNIYRKWNARLFEELYRAFIEGRSDKDPSEFWYKGEMGFFDFYIIPLVKKLKDCGVFGVSSDEYLNYAMKNRQEWEDRGLEVVAGLVEDIEVKLTAEKKVFETAPEESDDGIEVGTSGDDDSDSDNDADSSDDKSAGDKDKGKMLKQDDIDKKKFKREKKEKDKREKKERDKSGKKEKDKSGKKEKDKSGKKEKDKKKDKKDKDEKEGVESGILA